MFDDWITVIFVFLYLQFLFRFVSFTKTVYRFIILLTAFASPHSLGFHLSINIRAISILNAATVRFHISISDKSAAETLSLQLCFRLFVNFDEFMRLSSFVNVVIFTRTWYIQSDWIRFSFRQCFCLTFMVVSFRLSFFLLIFVFIPFNEWTSVSSLFVIISFWISFRLFSFPLSFHC